jgi:hypothetical protein
MTNTNASDDSAAATPTKGEVVARGATYYRMTRYIMVAVLFGYGLWSIRDGFSRYPRENAEDRAAGKDIIRHPGLDVPFNQFFGVVLPPLSIVMLICCLRKSRGEITFDGQTLSAPGHPSVPLDAITAVDQRLWDRKGIAYVDYELPDRKGRITLDDFIYDRDPIDEIHKRVTQYIAPPDEPEQTESGSDKA